MGTILFTWELGGGLGHMMQMHSLAQELLMRGHRVFAALRDLSRARGIFRDGRITLLPAPVKIAPTADPVRMPLTFAHILHNVGYADFAELDGLTGRWRELFDTIRPQVIICDHSPTALLASRGLPMRRITLGTGFFCPPDQRPLPNLRYWVPADRQKLLSDELAVLARMNRVLERRSQPKLEQISRLYLETDDSFLMTFKELDHYPNRPGPARYRGTWNRMAGKAPTWPAGAGKKVYAYLKNFDSLPYLLKQLKEMELPTLAFVDGVSRLIHEQFACATLKFSMELPDIKSIAAECDVAILNANHGTTVALLLAGKPTLQIPIYLEQDLFARAVCRLGAGLQAPPQKPAEIVTNLSKLVETSSFGQAAGQFAQRYRNFEPAREHDKMADRVDQLMG